MVCGNLLQQTQEASTVTSVHIPEESVGASCVYMYTWGMRELLAERNLLSHSLAVVVCLTSLRQN